MFKSAHEWYVDAREVLKEQNWCTILSCVTSAVLFVLLCERTVCVFKKGFHCCSDPQAEHVFVILLLVRQHFRFCVLAFCNFLSRNLVLFLFVNSLEFCCFCLVVKDIVTCEAVSFP